MGRRRGVSSPEILEQNRQIVRRYLQLCEEGHPSPATVTAREFMVSRQRVYQIVTDPDRLRLARDG